MKTVLVALEFPPKFGGVETYYGKVAEYWPEELGVIDNSNNRLISPNLPLFGWLRGFIVIWRYIKANRPDWLLAGEILPIGTIAWILSFFGTFKYAVILHGLDFSLATKSSLKRYISKQILSRANLVLSANSFTAEQVKTTFPIVKNITVINPGVEINLPKISENEIIDFKKAKELEEAFTIVTLGRLVKRKGVDMVLAALAEVSLIIPKLRYIIIGDGPEKAYLTNIIHQLDLDDNVRIVSNISDEEKNLWLASSDIFIMTARNINGDYEGFGIAYLEAGVFSKPVIAGSSGGVSEAVQDDINGLIVNEEDSKSIAAAIIRLYNDRDLSYRLGKKGQEKSLQQSWKIQVDKIYSLLKNI